MKRCVFLSLLLGLGVISAQSGISDQRISEGSDLTIPCENEGSVRWSRLAGRKREIISGLQDGDTAQSNHRYNLLTNLSLVIKEAWVSDSGLYFCNSTAVVNLTVTPLKAMFDQRISEGSDITIPCDTQGKVSWSRQVDRKREIILTAQRGDIVRSKSDHGHRYSLLTNSSLVIKKAEESDSGTYYCNKDPVLALTVTPLRVYSEISIDGTSGSATRITDGVNGPVRVLLVSLAALICSSLQ